jgi:hypothetical protein
MNEHDDPDDPTAGSRGFPPPPPPPLAPLPPPLAPARASGRPAWLWFAIPLFVGAWAYLALSRLDDEPGRDRADCPTGGLSTNVENQSVEPLVPPVPGVPPNPDPLYEIDLEIKVVNRGTAPIDLVTIDVGVAGEPDHRIQGRAVRDPIEPQETITVPAYGLAPGTPPAFPVADPQDIEVQARWSNPDNDVDLGLCSPPA